MRSWAWPAIQSLAQPCSLTLICLLCCGWCQSFSRTSGELLTTQVMDHSVDSATPSLAGLGPSPALMCPQVPRNPVKMQTQIQDPEEHLRFCIAHNLPRDSLLLILGLHFNSKPFEHGL